MEETGDWAGETGQERLGRESRETLGRFWADSGERPGRQRDAGVVIGRREDCGVAAQATIDEITTVHAQVAEGLDTIISWGGSRQKIAK